MANTYSLLTAMHDAAGNFSSNVFHFQLSEAGTDNAYGYATKLINAWLANSKTTYLVCLGSDVILDFVQAKRITGGGGPSATRIVAEIGTGSATSRSAGLCADIAWQCNAGTNRPAHTYIPSIPGDAMDSGFFTPGYGTVIDDFTITMLTAYTLSGADGNADFGQFSRKLSQFNKATSATLKPKPTMLNKRTLPIV
jgi:hypothetical protein